MTGNVVKPKEKAKVNSAVGSKTNDLNQDNEDGLLTRGAVGGDDDTKYGGGNDDTDHSCYQPYTESDTDDDTKYGGGNDADVDDDPVNGFVDKNKHNKILNIPIETICPDTVTQTAETETESVRTAVGYEGIEDHELQDSSTSGSQPTGNTETPRQQANQQDLESSNLWNPFWLVVKRLTHFINITLSSLLQLVIFFLTVLVYYGIKILGKMLRIALKMTNSAERWLDDRYFNGNNA